MEHHLVGEREHSQLDRIEDKLDTLERTVSEMAIDQTTFDTDLAALVAAITTLTTAVDALIASTAPTDLTAEDTSVQTASAAVAAELAKLNPSTTPPAPTG